MKTFIIAALLALTVSTAFAGDNTVRGTIVVGPEWTTMEVGRASTPSSIVRFKTTSALGKRILRVCPDGSKCEMGLSISERPKDHRIEGRFLTLIKWPEDRGVMRDTP